MSVFRSKCRVAVAVVLGIMSMAGFAASADPGEIQTHQTESNLPAQDTSWMTTDYAELARATKAATWSPCTPSRVGVFNNRVHVRCTVANAGIFYYAFPTQDQAAVARVLALFNSALLTGRSLSILNDPADTTSGPPLACQASDCRLVLSLELL